MASPIDSLPKEYRTPSLESLPADLQAIAVEKIRAKFKIVESGTFAMTIVYDEVTTNGGCPLHLGTCGPGCSYFTLRSNRNRSQYTQIYYIHEGMDTEDVESVRQYCESQILGKIPRHVQIVETFTKKLDY